MSQKLPHHHHIIGQYYKAKLSNTISTQFQGVLIQDGICGIGKTTSAYEQINKIVSSPNDTARIIYVGMYIDELLRVGGMAVNPKKKEGDVEPLIAKGKPVYKDPPTNAEFQFPLARYGKGSKLSHLKGLLRNNDNVVITHNLFLSFDEEVLDILRERNYHLIIDEEPAVISTIDKKYSVNINGEELSKYTLFKNDINDLLDTGLIEVDYNNQTVQWKGPRLKRYDDLITDIERNHVHYRTIVRKNGDNKVTEPSFIWRYNPNAFKVFSTVRILTYLYKGSILNAYFDINKIPYYVEDMTDGSILDYVVNEKGEVVHLVSPVHELINLHKPRTLPFTPLKDADDREHKALSVSYFKTFRDNPDTKIKKALGNYFKYKFNGKVPSSDQKMWTTLSDAEYLLRGKGYSKGFVVFNKRASNAYRKRDVLAFAYDPYMFPDITNYSKFYGASVSSDQYAVSTLIQWVFRSALRDDKPIKLFILAPRLLKLFEKWLKEFKDAYQYRVDVRDNYHTCDYDENIVPLEYITVDEFLKLNTGLSHITGIKNELLTL